MSYGNALPWNRAVTFVVNHDIPHNNGFRGWLLDRQDEHLAYAYILGRDGGVPLIYSDHNESAYPEDVDRWHNIYQRPDIVAMIQFHNALQGQPMAILYESDLLLIFRRGDHGIVAINKGVNLQKVELNTWGLKNPGQYRDLLHPSEMTVTGNQFSLLVPPRTAQLWLAK
jgi:alpha-amylase